MPKFPYRCLYIIKHHQTGLIKIGISNNWYSRAKALKVGTATYPIVVVLTENCANLERQLHEEYNEYRLPGSEYFSLDTRAVGEAVSTALQYGSVLPNWSEQPHTPFDPARALLQQDYVEVTRCFHTQLCRQIRLRYAQKLTCILEFMDLYLDKETLRKFTIYLDIEVQKLKLKRKGTWLNADWYLRLEVCEQYLQRLFNTVRVYAPTKLPSPDCDLKSSLCFTTVRTCKAFEYTKLPLLSRVIIERLWCQYDLYSNFWDMQNAREKQKDNWFTYYLESDGPYHYTVDKPLPIPVFHC